MNKEQALILIDQLGGNKFNVMVGAKNYVFGDNGLTFKIGRNCHGINGVRIQLEPTDVYTVEFLRVSKKGVIVKSKHEGVYCNELRSLFEKQTGMVTSLF